jgi:hypothetical protein
VSELLRPCRVYLNLKISRFKPPTAEKFAPGLKQIEDATSICRRILIAFEHAEAEEDPDERRRLLTFAVIGAGPTGVELAGAIAELAKVALARDFRTILSCGIPLSKIHHAAFDAHLIGIDPDYRLHVSERLLGQEDGPMLEALKALNGAIVHLPNRTKDRPDRDRLALRFGRFKTAV